MKNLHDLDLSGDGTQAPQGAKRLSSLLTLWLQLLPLAPLLFGAIALKMGILDRWRFDRHPTAVKGYLAFGAFVAIAGLLYARLGQAMTVRADACGLLLCGLIGRRRIRYADIAGISRSTLGLPGLKLWPSLDISAYTYAAYPFVEATYRRTGGRHGRFRFLPPLADDRARSSHPSIVFLETMLAQSGHSDIHYDDKG